MTSTNTDSLDLTFCVDGKPYTGTVYDNTPRNHWDTDLEARVQFARVHYVCNGIGYWVDMTFRETNYGGGERQLRESCAVGRKDGRVATDAGISKGWQLCRALKEQVQQDLDSKVRPLAIQARINRCEAEANNAQLEAEKWTEAGIKARRISI